MTPEEKRSLGAVLSRLEYAQMQMGREARFHGRWKSEDGRFFRGYDALTEGVSELQGLWRKAPVEEDVQSKSGAEGPKTGVSVDYEAFGV